MIYHETVRRLVLQPFQLLVLVLALVLVLVLLLPK